MSASPTSRTLATLRDEGWIAAVVEHWNQYAKIRQDLFGFADIIAFNQSDVLLVQCTDGSSVSKRVDKVRASDMAKVWAEGPCRYLEVWGWAQRGARGKRKTWTARRVKLYTKRGTNGLEWITDAECAE
jgi:hypothetical protein